MQIELQPLNELTPSQSRRWAEIQRSRADLDSPFFAPEYAAAVARARPDAELAVIREGGVERGFFPFHRRRFGVAKPIGLGLTDFQGVVADEALDWNVTELLAACRLGSWHFNHLITSQPPLGPFQVSIASSPTIDLADGFDAYRLGRRAAGSQLVDQLMRKERKLTREQGPLRFTWQADEDAAFDALLRWKRDQQQRTGARTVLRQAWVVAVLNELRFIRGEHFAGMLSTLHVGDHLAAVHFGLRSGPVLHWWFPTYNPEYDRYSPGLILLVAMMRAADGEGVARIDLGKGDERYKASVMTGSTPVAEGVACRHVATGAAWTALYRARQSVRNSPLRAPAQIPKRLVRRLGGWLARP